MALKQQLCDGKARLGVWGCGYIGLTTMVNFAQQGIYAIGYDVDTSVVNAINGGRTHIPNLNYWLGYDMSSLLKSMVEATNSFEDMLSDNVKVHLVAIPTEKNGEPWFEPLRDVMVKIAAKKPVVANPDLVVIESTLTPGMLDNIVVKTLGDRVGREFLVGIAPRRDWFDSPEKNLKTLARVIGGVTPEASAEMKEVLGIVCSNLIVADAHTVELVKSVENSILHICATYACQLAVSYPNVDIAEVLRLASTHWRIPLYYPSVGTGGYCIPVSSKYVQEGAQRPDYLTLTREAIRFDSQHPYYVADVLAGKVGGGTIGVMGLSYKRDLKVHVLSPSLKIIERLKGNGVNVMACDPYYTDDEIRRITGVNAFRYPEEIMYLQGLVIVPPHRIFGQTPKDVLFKYLKRGMVILDNEGVWNKWRQDFVSAGIDYHRVGDKGWIPS